MTKNDLSDVSNFYVNQHMGAKKANSVNHCIRKISVQNKGRSSRALLNIGQIAPNMVWCQVLNRD